MERLESEFRRREQTIWLEQHFQLSEVTHRVNALLGTAPEVNSEATGKITPIIKEPDQTYFMELFAELRETKAGLHELATYRGNPARCASGVACY
jgi:hypothetical protein